MTVSQARKIRKQADENNLQWRIQPLFTKGVCIFFLIGENDALTSHDWKGFSEFEDAQVFLACM